MTYATIISHTGTRHIVGTPSGQAPIPTNMFRTTTLCGFGVRPQDALPEAIRDCRFCLIEWEAIERQEQTTKESDSAATVPPSSLSSSIKESGAASTSTAADSR